MILDDEFFKEKFDITNIEDNIYNQFAKNMARCLDIDLAKTPLVDILTGYTRYKILELRINKATECIKDFLCTEEYIKVDGKAIADNYIEVLNLLGGSDE